MSCRRPTPFVPPPGCRAGSLSPSSTNIRVERLAPFARNSRASLRVTNDPITVEPSTTTNLRATDLFIGRAQNFFSLDRFQRGAAPPWGQPHRAPYNHICKPLRTCFVADDKSLISTGDAIASADNRPWTSAGPCAGSSVLTAWSQVFAATADTAQGSWRKDGGIRSHGNSQDQILATKMDATASFFVAATGGGLNVFPKRWEPSNDAV